MTTDQWLPLACLAVGFFLGFYFRESVDWLLLQLRPMRGSRRRG